MITSGDLDRLAETLVIDSFSAIKLTFANETQPCALNVCPPANPHASAQICRAIRCRAYSIVSGRPSAVHVAVGSSVLSPQYHVGVGRCGKHFGRDRAQLPAPRQVTASPHKWAFAQRRCTAARARQAVPYHRDRGRPRDRNDGNDIRRRRTDVDQKPESARQHIGTRTPRVARQLLAAAN